MSCVSKTLKMVSVASACAICGAGVVTATHAAGGGDGAIDKKDVPAAVISAFTTAYPQATIKECRIENKNGVQYYEIEYKQDKVKGDISYDVNGAPVEVSEKIKENALPEAVRKTLASAYPKAEIEKAEKTSINGAVEYEVDVESGKDVIDVVVDPSGRILSATQKVKNGGGKEEHGGKDNGDEEDDD